MCFRPARINVEGESDFEGDAPASVPSPRPSRSISAAIPGLRNLSDISVDYPELPGSSSIRTNLAGPSINDAALWRFLKKAVLRRKEHIDCCYESPVTALIQNPKTKAVVGVEIERDGRKVLIAARNGVVLACGGCENALDYMQQVATHPKTLPVGSPYNEGDGIRLAQAVGARLWHMNVWESGGAGLAPEDDRTRSVGDSMFFKRGSCFLVGGDARRYIAEDLEQRHGRVLRGGSWLMPSRPERNFFVFDEAHRRSVAEGDLDWPFFNWDDEFSHKVDSGAVIKADSIDELAERLDLDIEELHLTIAGFNQAALSGNDAFGRQIEHMRPFGEAPYYGVPVFPVVRSTQGGPERSARAEAIGVSGEAIPHLYVAGELGGLTSYRYQNGANLSECIVFGNIAGAEAAKDKGDALFTGESKSKEGGFGDESEYDQIPDEEGLSVGESLGVGEGLCGPIWVRTFSFGGLLNSVEVVRHCEFDGIGAQALDDLVIRANTEKTADLDVVSGATVTSKGFKEAVDNALGKRASGWASVENE